METKVKDTIGNLSSLRVYGLNFLVSIPFIHFLIRTKKQNIVFDQSKCWCGQLSRFGEITEDGKPLWLRVAVEGAYILLHISCTLGWVAGSILFLYEPGSIHRLIGRIIFSVSCIPSIVSATVICSKLYKKYLWYIPSGSDIKFVRGVASNIFFEGKPAKDDIECLKGTANGVGDANVKSTEAPDVAKQSEPTTTAETDLSAQEQNNSITDGTESLVQGNAEDKIAFYNVAAFVSSTPVSESVVGNNEELIYASKKSYYEITDTKIPLFRCNEGTVISFDGYTCNFLADYHRLILFLFAQLTLLFVTFMYFVFSTMEAVPGNFGNVSNYGFFFCSCVLHFADQICFWGFMVYAYYTAKAYNWAVNELSATGTEQYVYLPVSSPFIFAAKTAIVVPTFLLTCCGSFVFIIGCVLSLWPFGTFISTAGSWIFLCGSAIYSVTFIIDFFMLFALTFDLLSV